MTQATSFFVPHGTYFFTVRLRDARADLLVRHVDVLRDATRLCCKRWPFGIAAAVILPNRLHMIWTLPAGDDDTAKRWRLIKSGFARHVPVPAQGAREFAQRGDAGVWQRGHWQHLIRDQDDFDRHSHVIRAAPVQAGLVTRAGDWPYSSLHHGLRRVRTTVPVPSSPDQEAGQRSSRTAVIAASENC